eukprot:15335726-Ditylum_brightwellii.AAC.1
MERSKQNKHGVCNKDNDVNNDFPMVLTMVSMIIVVDGDDGADKHLTHLSQLADYCCLIERNKQHKHAVYIKDDDFDNDVDNGDDGVNDEDADCVDGVDDGTDKHLTYLSQVADCC